MKKILFFFLILNFNFSNLLANTEAKNKDVFFGCNNKIDQNYLNNYEKLKINKIEIDVFNYRNWTVNSVKIITTSKRYVDDIYKKRFKAKITISYVDGSKCTYKGRVRHSGDQKDHISLHDNNIIQSLDIHLDDGNIRGITKFKLLRPNTRGVLEDVIIQNQLLRNLDYLAPRSIKLNARINKTNSIMLFQEKASKELLEYNNRREGPILEANEKYFWKALKDVPDNQLSNWSAGVVPLLNQSSKHMLAKLTNSNLIMKNENLKEISFNALSKLNLIYLYYSNRFQDTENNFNHWEYDLDNSLLGLFEKQNIKKLDIYSLLLQSTNSTHGLAANNRKFYWNAFNNYFEPIHYDANPNIEANIDDKNIRFPVTDSYLESFHDLETQIKDLNLKLFKEELISNGLEMSENEIKKKFNKILINLGNIKNNYNNFTKKDKIHHNQFKNIINLTDIFFKNRKEVDPNILIVKQKKNTDALISCKIFSQECEDLVLKNQDIAKLLEGELKLNGSTYEYLGINFNLENIGKVKEYKKIKFKNTDILFEKDIQVSINESLNIIDIFQKNPGSKIFFKNGELNNLKINFHGYNLKTENNEFNLKTFPPNYPINNTLLTGCLSFINLKVTNISIDAKNSSCEDTVNFVNVNGHLNKINIINSFSDALDIDFSNLKISQISINSSLNDCADFSGGVYFLEKLELIDCGDKGLSIGEKSFVKLKNITVQNANIGIASKDSSIFYGRNVDLINLKTCVAAYKKKQEFNGGFIDIKEMKCKNYFKKADLDSYSKILVKENVLKNSMYGQMYDPLKLKITNINGKKLNKNLHQDFKTFNKDKTINVVIEISKGMREKWKISKSSKGDLAREFYMGKLKNIKYKPYPVNYGIIPQTVLPLRIGGDGDPLDAIVLGSPITQGKVIKVKILGIIRMTDFGDIDDKIVTVPIDSEFSKFENLLHLQSKYPEKINEIKEWFNNYKGKNVVNIEKLDSVLKANELIIYTNSQYKKNGLKPRG
jgi:inorganic pyrophosphatase